MSLRVRLMEKCLQLSLWFRKPKLWTWNKFCGLWLVMSHTRVERPLSTAASVLKIFQNFGHIQPNVLGQGSLKILMSACPSVTGSFVFACSSAHFPVVAFLKNRCGPRSTWLAFSQCAVPFNFTWSMSVIHHWRFCIFPCILLQCGPHMQACLTASSNPLRVGPSQPEVFISWMKSVITFASHPSS